MTTQKSNPMLVVCGFACFATATVAPVGIIKMPALADLFLFAGFALALTGMVLMLASKTDSNL